MAERQEMPLRNCDVAPRATIYLTFSPRRISSHSGKLFLVVFVARPVRDSPLFDYYAKLIYSVCVIPAKACSLSPAFVERTIEKGKEANVKAYQ
jgi:hypothetical protein